MQWIEWRWRRMTDFDVDGLYQMLALRQRVFVVEQKSPYLDTDGLDRSTEHLTGHDGDTLAACLRLLPPSSERAEAGIGRVAVDRNYRRQGLAREMMRLALARVREHHGSAPVRLAAQDYLVPFYASFGFDPVSAPYDDDGVLHVDMLLADD
jgi:ElaA protein